MTSLGQGAGEIRSHLPRNVGMQLESLVQTRDPQGSLQARETLEHCILIPSPNNHNVSAGLMDMSQGISIQGLKDQAITMILKFKL